MFGYKKRQKNGEKSLKKKINKKFWTKFSWMIRNARNWIFNGIQK